MILISLTNYPQIFQITIAINTTDSFKHFSPLAKQTYISKRHLIPLSLKIQTDKFRKSNYCRSFKHLKSKYIPRTTMIIKSHAILEFNLIWHLIIPTKLFPFI